MTISCPHPLSELKTLCQKFPVLIELLKHLNHQVIRTKSTLSEFKSHLSYSLIVAAWKRSQAFPWPTLPYPCWCFPAQWIREELQEMSVNSVCATLQMFDVLLSNLQ